MEVTAAAVPAALTASAAASSAAATSRRLFSMCSIWCPFPGIERVSATVRFYDSDVNTY
jgi:hypothetical protein